PRGRRPHVPDVGHRPPRRAARPVHGRALRAGGVADRRPQRARGDREAMRTWVTGFVGRIPASVHTKLLAAFLVSAALLIVVGAVGLQVLSEVNRRAEDLVKLQRKIAAYRQLQHDTTSQLYSVASALNVPEDRTLEATLRQLNQFGYDLDRLQFVAKDEVELLGQVREDYEKFIRVVTRVIDQIHHGKAAEGRDLQLREAGPLADR